MPRMNGTGPRGLGAKTGRGMGNCDISSTDTNNLFTNDMGFGRGFCRYTFQGSNNGFDEKAYLEGQKEIIEERLNYLNNQKKK